jgi:hypothetical protein
MDRCKERAGRTRAILEGPVVRCSCCRARFELIETVWPTTGGVLGPPATPRQLLVIGTLLFSTAAAVSLLFAGNGLPIREPSPGPLAGVAVLLLIAGAFFLAYWPCNYLGWLVDVALFPAEARAGTCPNCRHCNWIWPWSG